MRQLPRHGHLALRDRALLLFLYNTGARVQEVADLRAEMKGEIGELRAEMSEMRSDLTRVALAVGAEPRTGRQQP